VQYKLLIIFSLILNSFANELDDVPITLKAIGYNKQIFKNNYKFIELDPISVIKYKIRCKEFPNKKLLKLEKYRTTHVINKNKVICKKDVKIKSSKKIKFNFGFLEIERDGEIIKETDKYIRIKNPDGTIEKIYKGVK
jgi:hypothetical protein